MFVGGTSDRKEPVEAEHSKCLTVESSNLPKHSECSIVDRLISFLFEIRVFLESEYS